MSLAVLLSEKNHVIVLDSDKDRVEKINKKQSTVLDKDIENFLSTKPLNLSATSDSNVAYSDADFVIVATPTDYNEALGKFDTSSVDSVVEAVLEVNCRALVVIKSTVPVGYILSLQSRFKTSRVVFSPEFLREGSALHDNLFPSRIVIGGKCSACRAFVNLLAEAAIKKNVETFYLNPAEAEAIKLFSNAYLAMRVAFFNELDSFALSNQLNTKDIIQGLSCDDRIGQGYNNPSFGYGGYCLPKDTKQLVSSFGEIPHTLIRAIVSSNEIRKDLIAEEILKRNPDVVGFYRVVMKSGSNNFRSSAISDIIRKIYTSGCKVVVFEPNIEEPMFLGLSVLRDLEYFKEVSDVIVANRWSWSLRGCESKVLCRDVFGEN